MSDCIKQRLIREAPLWILVIAAGSVLASSDWAREILFHASAIILVGQVALLASLLRDVWK